MAKTDVKLYSIDNYGKATTATVSDVNPDAPNSQLVQMGRLFNNLTQNTYSKTDRINTINCDTESGGGAKQTTTLTLSNTSCTIAELKNSGDTGSVFAQITTNSDGALFVKQSEFTNYQSVASVIYTTSNGTYVMFFSVADRNGQAQTVPQTVTIYQAESDTYKAAEVTFTITA